jgi:hypothetical protein
VTSQLNKSARVVCVRDDGDKGVIEWFSEPITTELAFNETNVNIGPNGDIYVTSGVGSPHALFAIKGNGLGLSKTSPWPKYMGNIQNNGSYPDSSKERPAAEVASGPIHDPSELQYDNGYFMTFSTGIGIAPGNWPRSSTSPNGGTKSFQITRDIFGLRAFLSNG